MEKFTVNNFRSIAKRNNLGGYSKLPKSELIAYLRTNLPRRVQEDIRGRTTSPEDIPVTRSLLDDDIPELSQQPLQPTQYIPPLPTPPPRGRRFREKLGRWLDWLTRFVPEPLKRPINNAFNAFKKKFMGLFPKQLKFEESKRSALKGFAEEHTIKATNQTFDPKTFFMVVKQKALEKFQSQKKVRLVLKARMEKFSPMNERSIIEVRNFQSKTAIVLESINLDELWTEIVEQILENISVFQMIESGWTFHLIVSLDIHT